MSFIAYLQIWSAVITCALVGASIMPVMVAVSLNWAFPKLDREPGALFVLMAVAIGFFGGIWLCIARFI